MSILETIQKLVWGPPLVCMLLGTGLWLMIRLKGVPIRKLPWAIRESIQANSKDEAKREKTGEGGEISAFSSLATELAATIGTGNIVGVVGAIMLGGPGALWWMLFSSVLGLATKLTESAISVKYRKKTNTDSYMGGPMITLSSQAFPYPKAGHVLAAVYAFFAILCAFGMGNAVQANSIAASVRETLGCTPRATGLILAVLVLLAVLGGVRMIAGISTFLVPAMGAIYLAGCLGILVKHADILLPAVLSSLQGAFDPKSISGGLFGTLTCSALESARWGISRGIFSNEAGLGASGISAAASAEQNPVRQGLISMTGVFFDTMVICTVTGLTFCVSGVMADMDQGFLCLQNGTMVGRDNGAGLMLAAFEGTYGRYGSMLLGCCITLFAFATILGWGYQGEQAFSYLFGERRVKHFRMIYGMIAFWGAILRMEWVWTISDICNGLLAIPNLICIIILAPTIRKDILEYFEEWEE